MASKSDRIIDAILGGDYQELSNIAIENSTERYIKDIKEDTVANWIKSINKHMKVGSYKATLQLLREISKKIDKIIQI